MDLNAQLAEVAKKYVGVKEAGNNRGPEVDVFETSVAGHPTGLAWCCDFVEYCVKEVEKTPAKSELFVTQGVLDMWHKTPVALRLAGPMVGAIVLWHFGDTVSGHCGIVTAVHADTIDTVEGNTKDGKGIVREGDGVYARTRHKHPVGSMRLLGYLKAFV